MPRVRTLGASAGIAGPTERTVLLAQGGYYVTTGLLPFVSRRAFETRTGPKRDALLNLAGPAAPRPPGAMSLMAVG
jgi:hypothetical protein